MDGEEVADEDGVAEADEPQSDATEIIDEDTPQDTDVAPESEAAAAKPTRKRTAAKRTTAKKATRKKSSE